MVEGDETASVTELRKYEVRSTKYEVRSLKYEKDEAIRPEHPTARLLIQRACMQTQPPEDLFERCFRFTCDVYDYCEDLVRLRGLPCRLAYPLVHAAGSGRGDLCRRE